MLVLMVFLGMIVAALIALNKEIKLSSFSWLGFVKSHGIALITNFVIGVIFILAKEEVSVFYNMGRLMAAVVGFTGQTIFVSIVDSITSTTPTAVGRNKK